jgi:flavin-dependent dehydrogenase
MATRIRGILYRCGSDAASVDFPQACGLAIRRRHLDAALLEHARRSGAQVVRSIVRAVDEDRVMTDAGAFRAKILVGADGANSIFHRRFAIRTRTARPRLGLATHVERFEGERDRVEVVLFEDGEVYLAPVDNGLTLVSFLLEPSSAIHPDTCLEALRRLLPDRTRRVRLSGPVLASAPLSRSVDRIAGSNWLLVGDSAGCIDPITGEGMSMALIGAETASAVVDGFLDGTGSLADYAARTAKLRSSIESLTKMILFAARHPWVARRVLRVRRWMNALVRVSVGMESFCVSRLIREAWVGR